MSKAKTIRIEPSQWNLKKMVQILKKFEKKKILVVGDIGVDRYTLGSVDRISPEAPVPIVRVEQQTDKLGLAANVGDNVVALGGDPLLVGVVGSDRAAEDLGLLLKASGINRGDLITDQSRRTILKERIVTERQQLLRVDFENTHPLKQDIEKKVIAQIKNSIKCADAAIIEDYGKGLLTKKIIQSVFDCAKELNLIVTVDPHTRTEATSYNGATLFKPNQKEAESLSGVVIRDEDSLWNAGHRLLKLTSAKYIVITRGKEGMALFVKGKSEMTWIPTYVKEVYDVSGAGDTVISVLTLALASGAQIEEAAILGNLAAGVEVGKRGTATVSPDEIRGAIEYFRLLDR